MYATQMYLPWCVFVHLSFVHKLCGLFYTHLISAFLFIAKNKLQAVSEEVQYYLNVEYSSRVYASFLEDMCAEVLIDILEIYHSDQPQLTLPMIKTLNELHPKQTYVPRKDANGLRLGSSKFSNTNGGSSKSLLLRNASSSSWSNSSSNKALQRIQSMEFDINNGGDSLASNELEIKPTAANITETLNNASLSPTSATAATATTAAAAAATTAIPINIQTSPRTLTPLPARSLPPSPPPVPTIALAQSRNQSVKSVGDANSTPIVNAINLNDEKVVAAPSGGTGKDSGVDSNRKSSANILGINEEDGDPIALSNNNSSKSNKKLAVTPSASYIIDATNNVPPPAKDIDATATAPPAQQPDVSSQNNNTQPIEEKGDPVPVPVDPQISTASHAVADTAIATAMDHIFHPNN